MSRRSTRKTLRFCFAETLPRCKIRGSVFRKRARMPQPPAQLARPLAHSHSAHTNTQRPRGGARPTAATAKLKAWLCRKRRLPGGSFCCPGSCFSETPLLRKCDVLNRGLSGYNTRWAKIVLPRLINKDHNAGNTLAVTIFFGANDSALKDENPRQHVPLEEYADNLKSMICYLNSVDISKQDIILVTPPPLHEPSWERECVAKGDKLNRLNSVTGRYAKVCVKVAEECGTDVIDLWTLMQKGDPDFSCYLADGIHLSEKGNIFLANQLWTLLEKKLSTLPHLLPCWRDVDLLHPEASLLDIPTNRK